MTETIALTRLAIYRHRVAMCILVCWALAGLAAGTATKYLLPDLQPMPILIIILFPAAMWSMGLFDYGGSQSITDGQSGFNHWLLRMPISHLKLALVPLVLRIAWLCGSWFLFTTATRFLDGVQLPIWSAASVVAAMGVWTAVVTWRPFTNAWWRIAVMCLAGITIVSLFTSILIAHFDDAPSNVFRWPGMPALLLASSVGLLISGIVVAVRSVQHARTNTVGFIGEVGRYRNEVPSGQQDANINASGRHSNRYRALVWHDIHRVPTTERRWELLIAGACLFFPLFVLPMTIGTIIFTVFFAGYMGAWASSSLLDPAKRSGSTLPSYLAASPMTSAEIGFARLAMIFAYSILVFCVTTLVVCIWWWWPENRMAADRWQALMTNQYQSPLASYRIIVAAILAGFLFIVTRGIGSTWVTLTGRSRFQMVAITAPILAFLGGVTVIIIWFLTQTDWESATANAWYWAAWLPAIGFVCLILKGFTTAATCWLLRRHQLLSAKSNFTIIAAWTMLTVSAGTLIYWLIPDQRIALSWCLLATALVVPVARVLLVPHAVYMNRHR
ncbi:MAG: hypothetical protein HKN47_21925 [Pirellulaceae bacterium]|nr:hypothetical protein [Pirellulaceae bacterium]